MARIIVESADTARRRLFMNYFRTGKYTLEQALKIAGVTAGTLQRWVNTSPSFATEYRETWEAWKKGGDACS